MQAKSSWISAVGVVLMLCGGAMADQPASNTTDKPVDSNVLAGPTVELEKSDGPLRMRMEPDKGAFTGSGPARQRATQRVAQDEGERPRREGRPQREGRPPREGDAPREGRPRREGESPREGRPPREGREQGPRGDRGPAIMPLLRELNLSDEQAQQVRAIMQESRAEMEEWQEKNREAFEAHRREVRDAIEAGDREKARELREAFQARHQPPVTPEQTEAKIVEVLNADQKARLEELKEARQQRMEERRRRAEEGREGEAERPRRRPRGEGDPEMREGEGRRGEGAEGERPRRRRGGEGEQNRRPRRPAENQLDI